MKISTDKAVIYRNNPEHLLDELHRIDLMIRFCLEKCKAKYNEDVNDLLGLYISEDEVNTILQNLPHGPKINLYSDSQLEEIEILTNKINSRTVESIKAKKELRLHILSELFQLDPFEIDILLICLAPELDLRYEKLYAYLQNDVTKKRPSVDIVLTLLCSSTEERFSARDKFSYTATLINNHLIYFTDDNSMDQVPLLSRPIQVDERIISYLLGYDEIDRSISNFSEIIKPEKSFSDILSTKDNKNTLKELVQWHSHKKVPLIFLFHGPYGTGKKMTAEAICKELEKPLMVVDSKALIKDGSFKTLNLILREARLQHSLLYLERFDVLLKEENTEIKIKNIMQELDYFEKWVFLSGKTPWELPASLINHIFINYTFPLPSYTLRKYIWESLINSHDNISGDIDFAALAGKFKFSGGQINDAIFAAINIAAVKQPGGSELSMSDLYDGCKAQSNKNLVAFAKKIKPHYQWEDIILPDDIKEQLKEINGYIKYKGTVYDDWGFDRKFSLGKGLNILFSGPSGAGKTMAAEIIANKVELDIYKIDLSSVVSKYIGETEKILNKIFIEAQTSNAILFFDEADALFGKRTEIRDSHDRYANIEVNYLLQKMEEHEGIVIMATNYKKNIDDAFLRRLHITIEFPFPDEKLRQKIWTNIFPEETLVDEAVDFNFMANFKITGGNIKNIALSAAFLSAGKSDIITMEHIIKATKREFQKMGKLCTSGDFREYYKFVK